MFLACFLFLLQIAALPAVLAAMIGAPEIRAVNTFTFGGDEVHVATVPLSASLISSTNTTKTPSSLSKRVTIDACFQGCPAETCTNGLSTLGAPLAADCTSLANAVNALALSELGPPPCNVNNQNCPNFSVAPGFERQYTFGTCLVGFANLNPTGGATLSFCDFLIGGTFPSIFNSCVVTAGNTGGFCNSDPQGSTLYAIEVRHS